MTRTSYQTGLAAERLCVFALRLKFYRILAVRYKTPVGEIDIIASKGRTVVAVEVKARSTKEAALECLTPKQRERIRRALQDFVMRKPFYAHATMRFDVMLALPRRWPLHIKNAWHA